MEESGGTDDIRALLEKATLLGSDGFKVIEGGETAIHERQVGQGPEVFL